MSNQVITFAANSNTSSKGTVPATRFDGSSLLGFRFPETWPVGTTIYFLEADGTDGENRPLVDTTGAIVSVAGMEADASFPKGKTLKDANFISMLYGLTNLVLYATPAPTTQQTIEVIVDKL